VSDPYDDGRARHVDDGPQHAAAPEPPVTGDVAVDEAVAAVEGVLSLPVDEQPPVYEGVHRALQDRLADVEG
jgi:hypothetical protein